MANVKKYTDQIAKSQKGRDVRDSIVKAINEVSDENNEYNQVKADILSAQSNIAEKVTKNKQTEQTFAADVKRAEELKQGLDTDITQGTALKSQLDDTVKTADTSKKNLDASNTAAGKTKTGLDATNKTAADLVASLGDKITEGTQVKTDIQTTGETAMSSLRAEAAKQQEYIKTNIDDTLSISGKAADAAATGKKIDSLKEDLSNVIDKQENLWTYGDVVNSYKANTQYQSKYYDIQLNDGEYYIQYDNVVGAVAGNIQVFPYGKHEDLIVNITPPNKSRQFSPKNGGVRIYFFSTLTDVAENDGVSTWSGIKLVKGTHIVNPSIKDSILPKFIQNVKIAESFEIVSNTFSSGESLALKVSNSKSRNHIGFDATINNMGKITIYYGKDMAYNDCKITIDSTEVVAYNCTRSWVEMARGNHGLVLSHHISVRIDTGNDKKAVISVTDETGKTYELQTEWVCGHGDVAVENKDGSYTKCKLTFYPSEYRQKVWAYGDSYFDLWPWICNAKGASHWMIDGFSGRGSIDAIKSLELALKHATPSIVLWCLGMNDPDTETEISATWLENIKKVKEICDENNITLIPTTIPNVPTRNHSFKNTYVRENFSRYVDISESLGAETSASWYSGLLPDGDIHPSSAGRVLIAQKVMCEVPEII